MLIEGPNISLSDDIRDEHAPGIAAAANCEDIHLLIGAHYFPFPYTEEDALYFINQNRRSGSETFKVDFIIFHDTSIIGAIGLSEFSSEDRSAHVGYWISCNYRNRGFASEALGLVCEYATKTLDLVRLHTKVMDLNTASLRVLLKNGFKVEGYEIKSFCLGGIYHDMFLLARLLQ